MDKEQIIKLVLSHKKLAIKIGLGLVIFIVCSFAYMDHQHSGQNDMVVISEAEESSLIESQESIEEQEEKIIIIDIGGAIQNPGIVKLKEGSRVFDAVEGAGGLTGNADTLNVNLAACISDGDKIYIPNKNESSQDNTQAGIITSSVSKGVVSQNHIESSSISNSLININQASSEQLQLLNGVGPSTAQKIIDYRQSAGGFKKIEDLMNVSGIGSKTFEKLKDKITV